MKAPYWLDSDVLIQAKNSYYAFDIAPGFWLAIEKGIASGKVYSPMMVHDELMKGGDELTDWAKNTKSLGLFKDPNKNVQAMVGQIATFVDKNFDKPNAKIFLEGADPWVISAAQVSGGTVVTHEAPGGIGCKRVKIPNICGQFGVPYMTCFEMLRKIKASF